MAAVLAQHPFAFSTLAGGLAFLGGLCASRISPTAAFALPKATPVRSEIATACHDDAAMQANQRLADQVREYRRRLDEKDLVERRTSPTPPSHASPSHAIALQPTRSAMPETSEPPANDTTTDSFGCTCGSSDDGVETTDEPLAENDDGTIHSIDAPTTHERRRFRTLSLHETNLDVIE